MIKQIKIENYKSIQNLEFELGRLNVIIGENGSGKSNILEAIAMGAVGSENDWHRKSLSSRGIRVTDPRAMRSGFQNGNSDKDIEIEFIDYFNEKRKYMLFYDNNEPFSEWAQRGTYVSEKDLEEMARLNSEEFENKMYPYKRLLKDYADFLIYAPENHFLRRFEDEMQTEPLGIRGEGLFKLLTVLYKQRPEHFIKIREHLQLIDWFEGLEIPDNLLFTERRILIKDRFLEDGLQYFDQKSSNEGFLYLLFYFSLFISDYTPKFFAIDNIDNSLNPKLCAELIRNLAKLAKEHDKQVILTTHNPAVLDGLNLNDDEQRLLVVYRNAYGHTKVNRILPKSLPEGIEPVRLSEQFLRGYIGGLPKNF